MVNNIIKVILIVIIVVLAYLVFESVMKPVRFNQQVEKRSDAVIQNLVDIRTAQMAFKNINGKYTASFDTLISFLEQGEIPVVKMIPDPQDTTFTKIIRDTIGYIPVKDSIFSNRPEYKVESIKYVPYTDNMQFKMDAGIIEKGGVNVNVFEVSVPFEVLLKGLNDQMVVNLIASKEQIDRYPGLKLGSMVEASTDGNWE